MKCVCVHTRVLLPVGRGHFSEIRRETVASGDGQRARAWDGVTPKVGDEIAEEREEIPLPGARIGVYAMDCALWG